MNATRQRLRNQNRAVRSDQQRDSAGGGWARLHFRFGMETTRSFPAAGGRTTQARLRELYVDYFYRRQDEFWKREALQKLPALKRGTDMLICGEDLGMVPACVPEVMRDLGLLSLEIQRMPKNPAWEFSRPAEAPYLSVVTPSTHDMSTIRGWWTEDPALTQKFYNRELGGTGPAPRRRRRKSWPPWWASTWPRRPCGAFFSCRICWAWTGELRRADVDAERINVPAIPESLLALPDAFEPGKNL
jgi:4-alpha-glucanotransferase